MSEEKQRDEAGQFGGVYGSKNKAVREKATRSLWKKLGIEMPSSGSKDRKVLNRILSGKKSGRMPSDEDSKMGGGKVKKNYSRGGGVRAAKY